MSHVWHFVSCCFRHHSCPRPLTLPHQHTAHLSSDFSCCPALSPSFAPGIAIAPLSTRPLASSHRHTTHLSSDSTATSTFGNAQNATRLTTNGRHTTLLAVFNIRYHASASPRPLFRVAPCCARPILLIRFLSYTSPFQFSCSPFFAYPHAAEQHVANIKTLAHTCVSPSIPPISFCHGLSSTFWNVFI